MCQQSVFKNRNHNALSAHGVTVDGDRYLSEMRCTGNVSLAGAHIKHMPHCSEAIFANAGGEALDATRLTVDGDMYLRAWCIGKVSLWGAHIKGVLDCFEAIFADAVGKRALDPIK
jgi:hypothetical protein